MAWKPAVGYEGLYEVSDIGQVRSLRRGTIMSLCLNSRGYTKASLVKDGIRKEVPVHRMVLLAFVGPCPDGCESRHFPDQNRANCKLSNLSWATRRVNQRDRDTNGTNNKGINNSNARLSEKTVRYIRSIKQWSRAAAVKLAHELKVDPHTIHVIRNNRSWRHL